MTLGLCYVRSGWTSSPGVKQLCWVEQSGCGHMDEPGRNLTDGCHCICVSLLMSHTSMRSKSMCHLCQVIISIARQNSGTRLNTCVVGCRSLDPVHGRLWLFPTGLGPGHVAPVCGDHGDLPVLLAAHACGAHCLCAAQLRLHAAQKVR